MWSGNYYRLGKKELFMETLAAQSDISEKTFSFYLTDTTGESYIDFGTPNQAVMNGTVTYIPVHTNSRYWTASIAGFRWDKQQDPD